MTSSKGSNNKKEKEIQHINQDIFHALSIFLDEEVN